MSGQGYISQEERRALKVIVEAAFLKDCYGSIPQRFRFKGRLMFVTQDTKGKDILMEIRE